MLTAYKVIEFDASTSSFRKNTKEPTSETANIESSRKPIAKIEKNTNSNRENIPLVETCLRPECAHVYFNIEYYFSVHLYQRQYNKNNAENREAQRFPKTITVQQRNMPTAAQKN